MASSDKIFQDGFAALNRRDMAEAGRLFGKFLKRHPSHVPGLNLMTVALMSQGRFGEAEEFIARAVRLDPSSDASFYNYGLISKELGKPQQALEQFDRSLRIKDSNPETWNNRGAVLCDLLRFEEAVADFDRALAQRPDYWEALANKAKPLAELRRFDEALTALDRVLSLKLDSVQAWIGRGHVFTQLERFTDAEAAYDKAISLQPDLPEAWLGRGKLFAEIGRDDDALASFAKATELSPDFADAHWDTAFLRLLRGDYAEGWRLYEWRWKMRSFTSPARNFKKPLWLGETPLTNKTILVHAEQGLGDAIQFARYVPLLRSKARRVLFDVHKPLAPLFRSQWPDVDVIEYGQPLPPFDVHCPLLSLPLAFRTTLDTVPADIPYLQADPEKIEAWRGRLGAGDRPRIGLVWSGNANFKKDHERRVRLETLAPLLTERCDWHVLQKDVHEHDREWLARLPQLRDFSTSLNDFADTAAIVAQMDLVISVDTGVAHLAGAMGKPVWVLLGFNADFRWLRSRTDSPWYPTAKLFRQSKRGDWTSVVNAVAAELDRFKN